MASSSVVQEPPHRFEIFISFRGEDTRNGFVSHLYDSLKKGGIDKFIDEETLEKGAYVEPRLFEGIEESKLSIIVLSENYASSTWCLKELTKILECQNSGQTVVPIFYDIDPSDVRNHKGKFAEAFAKHEEKFKNEAEKVEEWKKAFSEVGNISGYDSRGRNESKLIKKIIKDISNRLHCTMSSVPSLSSDLVGMGPIISDIEGLLRLGYDGVRMLGIWGMGGIGKSKIAEVIYEKIKDQFEACYFNKVNQEFRNGGQICLQRELLSKILKHFSVETVVGGSKTIKSKLSSKKVLIVFDGVDDSQQLEALVGNHNWFGSGSRIIITTRDRQLLYPFQVDVIYEVPVLDHDDAVQLFTKHAFKQGHPIDTEFKNLSTEIVKYCSGLPLALKILGSFMCGRNTSEWKAEIEKLERNPHEDIQNVLISCYNGLDSWGKELFLDIACFFNGWDKDLVMEILEACELNPICRMGVLVNKSLVTIDKENGLEIISMHDLLEEMGKEIVRQEAVDYPGKRSRLFKYEDIYNIFTKDTGTDGVKGISLCLAKYKGLSKKIHLSRNAFAKMSNIRLLNFRIHCSKDKFCLPNPHEVHPFEGRQFNLPFSLKYLHWHGFPLTRLPSDSNYENLKVLEIPCSPIKMLWKGTQRLGNLVVLNLTRCPNLKKIPDLSEAPELEKLIFEDCSSLVKVHPSVGSLPKLTKLNLRGCTKLKYLPEIRQCEGSLQLLDLSCCSNLYKCPDIYGTSKCLTRLILDGTSIKELSSTIVNLQMLEVISLEGCSKLKTISGSIWELKSLERLSLRGCSKLSNFPEISKTMPKLYFLDLSRTSITTLPSSICKLKSLMYLYLVECSRFSDFPEILEDMPNLLSLGLIGTAITTLPSSLCKLESLYEVSFLKCQRLTTVPDVVGAMTWLRSLIFKDVALATLPNGICQLKYCTKVLHLDDCNLYQIPHEIKDMSNLEALYLCGNPFASLPDTMKQLLKLEILDISRCKGLRSLPELPPQLRLLEAADCISLERFTPFPQVETLYAECPKLEGQHIWEIIRTSILGKVSASKIQDEYYEFRLENIWSFQLGREITYSRSEIVEWFMVDHSRGSTFTFDLPADVVFTSHLALFFCLVVQIEESSLRPFLYGYIHESASPVNHTHDLFVHDKRYLINTKGSDQVIVICSVLCPRERKDNDATDVTYYLDLEKASLTVKRCGVCVIDRFSGLTHQIRNFNMTDEGWHWEDKFGELGPIVEDARRWLGGFSFRYTTFDKEIGRAILNRIQSLGRTIWSVGRKQWYDLEGLGALEEGSKYRQKSALSNFPTRQETVKGMIFRNWMANIGKMRKARHN